MFKKKLLCRVEESEVINFCNILGMYGIKFTVSNTRNMERERGFNQDRYYRVIAVYATNHQIQTLYDRFNKEYELRFERRRK